MGLAQGEGLLSSHDRKLHLGTNGWPMDAAVPAAAWVIMVAGKQKQTVNNKNTRASIHCI